MHNAAACASHGTDHIQTQRRLIAPIRHNAPISTPYIDNISHIKPYPHPHKPMRGVVAAVIDLNSRSTLTQHPCCRILPSIVNAMTIVLTHTIKGPNAAPCCDCLGSRDSKSSPYDRSRLQCDTNGLEIQL